MRSGIVSMVFASAVLTKKKVREKNWKQKRKEKKYNKLMVQ